MDQVKLRRLAQGQLGLFSRGQAKDCEFSDRQIRWRVETGDWCRVVGDVLAPVDLPITASVLDRAGPLAVPGGVIAGPSAARAWGMPVPDRGVYLAVARNRHPRVRGLAYLRTDIGQREVSYWEGAAVTDRTRTVLDCLRLLPRPAARDLFDRALQVGWVTLADAAAYLHRFVGARGIGAVLALVRTAAAGTRSEAERVAGALLRSANIGGWTSNVAVADARDRVGVADILFAAERLVLELDGWAFHVTPDRFQNDRRRQNRLVAAGYTVLRFTWRDLTERPEYVVMTVRRMLTRMRTAGGYIAR